MNKVIMEYHQQKYICCAIIEIFSVICAHRFKVLFNFLSFLQATTLPRRFRTTKCTVTASYIREAKDLLVRECIKTYTSNWNVIHYKYSGYSGSYLQLPKYVLILTMCPSTLLF